MTKQMAVMKRMPDQLINKEFHLDRLFDDLGMGSFV